jgi:hypothetical protein
MATNDSPKDSPDIFSSTGDDVAFSGADIKGPTDYVKNQAQALDKKAAAAAAAEAKAKAKGKGKAEARKAAETKAKAKGAEAKAAEYAISELEGMSIKDESDIAPAEDLPLDFYENIQSQQKKTLEGIEGLKTELQKYINPGDFKKFMEEIKDLDSEIIGKLIGIITSEKEKLEKIKQLNDVIKGNDLLEGISDDTFNIQSNLILNKLRGEIITSLEEKIGKLDENIKATETRLTTATGSDKTRLEKELEKYKEALGLLKTQIKQMNGTESGKPSDERKYMKYKLKYLKLKNELKNKF